MDGFSRKLGIIIILGAAVCITLNQPVSSVSEVARSASVEGGQLVKHLEKLQVLLTCDKAKVSLQDVLTMDVAIRNDGGDDVYLFQSIDWGAGGGVARYIEDQKGNLVVAERGVLAAPPSPDDPAMVVRLEQGSFYGIRSRMKAKDLIPHPGKYTMKVIYRCPFARNMLPDRLRGLPVVTLEDPGVESNEVGFEVVP